jgi:hypothetical protein
MIYINMDHAINFHICIKEDEMGGACSMYGRIEKYMQTFGQKNLMKKTTFKMWRILKRQDG